MKGIILLNGEPYSGKIAAEGALVYCCDGAYRWAKNKVRIDKNLGDFDSLDEIPFPPPEEVYPSEKDFTDGEIALFQLLDKGVDEIEIYGGGGGREDHFLGNLHLLYRAHANGVKCKMITDNSLIFPASGKIFLGKFAGKTLSVLPFGGELHIIDSAGLKYSYPPCLSYGECRGISNISQSPSAYLTVEGCALVIINGGEV
ncbi:MAG: thiamine diphosphokinase [Clostridia bacterium]|nr:thiamine diphosphokinase [Clostridia bacterium]